MALLAPADSGSHVLDPLVVNPGRLSILLALAGDTSGLEFVHLRHRTGLTDGNLASHGRRLAGGGLIDITKQFRDGKPVTTYLLTPIGRRSLHAHVDGLMSAVAPKAPAPAITTVQTTDDDWID